MADPLKKGTSMTDFTPGPWIAQQDPLASDPDDYCVGNADGIDTVAVCSKRDAFVLAAAPDLYDACVQAEAVLSIVEPRSDKAEYLRILGVVRAALAKARGE